MTTLIYKFTPKYMGKSKYTLRLCGFCPEDGDKFTVRLPADGKVMLGEVEKTTRGGACQFSSRELHDGVLTPKALIGGKLYTAEPIIIDGGTLIPTAADAAAVMELIKRVGYLEEKCASLEEEVGALREKIGTKQIFRLN
jgi:hypothetical protein